MKLIPIKKKKYSRNRKVLLRICVFFSIFLVLVIVYIAVSIKPARTAYNSALEGRRLFDDAQHSVEIMDMSNAAVKLDAATNEFKNSQNLLKRFRVFNFVPFLGKQVSAVDNLLSTVIYTGTALAEVAKLSHEIIAPFSETENLTFSHLSREDKRQIFSQIEQAQPRLQEVKLDITRAKEYFEKIPTHGLHRKIREVIDPISKQFPSFEASVTQAIEVSEFVPRIVGFPDPQTYLFLLQNNTEMRPTGGFIGTYGILVITDGEIQSFTTDNVYNLDKTSEGLLFIDPPWQLTRYNDVHQWFLRDSNWSPDFPTSARQAIDFYRLEGGKESLDGVIAITPTLIASLLSLTGPITVDGIEFTGENFVETLQYQVEQGYLRQEIPEEERKDIVGDLSNILMEKLFALPREKWQLLWSTIAINLAEKHALIYTTDSYIQNRIVDQNWSGSIPVIDSDFLMVIDANLASLKSDPVVERTISYDVTLVDKSPTSTLTIQYTNTGTYSWKTTRYRTYTRVYVPDGATLLSSSGAMVDCKNESDGDIEVTHEFGKTVFGAFVCTEVGETESLSLTYQLPSTFIKDETYKLHIQKQPGTTAHALHVTIQTPRKPDLVQPLDSVTAVTENGVTLSMPLIQDRNISVIFK